MQGYTQFRAAPEESSAPHIVSARLDMARLEFIAAAISLWRSMDAEDLEVLVDAISAFDEQAVEYMRTVACEALPTPS